MSAASAQSPSGDSGRLDGASRPRIFLIMVVVALFTEIAPLQSTMIIAAVRQIAPSFPGVGANISWMLIILFLAGGASTPIVGKMSDLWGKRRMLLISGLAFAAGTLVCALTTSWPLFLVGRGVEAIGISAQTVAFGLFRDILPRRYVPVGIGMIAAGIGIGIIGGPLLGGWLLEDHSWRWLFWVLLILVGVVTPLVALIVPESRLRVRERLDLAGAVLLATGVGLVLLYLSNGTTWGWGRATSLAWLFGGLLSLAAFVYTERRASHPIMDMRLLMAPKLSLVLIITLLGGITVGILGYAIPYMMQSPTPEELTAAVTQQVLQGLPPGLPPAVVRQIHVHLIGSIDYGLGMTLLEYATHAAVILGGFTVISGLWTGVRSRHIGLRIPLIMGMATLIVAASLFSFFHHAWWQYALISATWGFGAGVFLSATPNLVVEAVPAAQQGISSGMLYVQLTFGVSVGTAILTAFQAARPMKFTVTVPGMKTSPAHTIPQLFSLPAFQAGLYVATATAALGLIVSALMRAGRTPATGGATT
jgi:MFS family permease